MLVSLTLSPTATQDAQALKIGVRVTNDGTKPVRLSATILGMPSVVLEVCDRFGRRVSLLPPPVPPLEEDLDWAELMPGQSISFTYSGGEIFGAPLAPGAYSVRFVFSPEGQSADSRPQDMLQSGQAHFTVW